MGYDQAVLWTAGPQSKKKKSKKKSKGKSKETAPHGIPVFSKQERHEMAAVLKERRQLREDNFARLVANASSQAS